MIRLLLKLVCLVLGAIIGTACSQQADEYGTPHARYIVDGKVVARQTQLPISGISITFGGTGEMSAPVLTVADGTWAVDQRFFPCNPCKVLARDPDGSDNGGSFALAELAVNVKQTAAGGTWYKGTFEAHDLLVELDPFSVDAGADGNVDGPTTDGLGVLDHGGADVARE